MQNPDLKREFEEFGDRFYYLGIFTIIGFFFPPIFLVNLIYYFLIVRNAKAIHKIMQDPRMEDFYKYLLYSLISLIIGIFISILFIIIFFSVMSSLMFTSYTYLVVYENIFYLILLGFLLASVIQFITGLLQMQAFESLNDFFRKHNDYFPPYIARDMIEGSKQLKTASILCMLGFLIITGLIAVIFQIIGYFKLARVRDFRYITNRAQSIPQRRTKDSQHQIKPLYPQNSNNYNYCPICGNKLQIRAKFCGNCGTNLYD